MGQMRGDLAIYSMARDASGTAWQPDSSPMESIHGTFAGWSTMLHGHLGLVYDNQGGSRGDDKTFSESMLMGMAQRPLGGGALTLRAMLSLDPLMGPSGYPLLLQTGETANGRTELIDRQHPHDLFMELVGAYSHPIARKLSGFVYFGYPGEPALGPATFMHRFSGAANPGWKPRAPGQLAPVMAATSAAKSLVSFSTPSPRAIRAKPTILTGEPSSLAVWATSPSMVIAGSRT